ncbi:MAG: hypothetical protein HON70_09010 [Lentisphaerae bacterium]|nr:hypothetical protein [Lentisphaerota bacterium]
MSQTIELGNGFRDHGVAAPVARSRGAVATVDGNGRRVILVYLYDHRACTSLLVIDAQTGQTSQVDVPPHSPDSPFAVILSSGNRFLTHFGGTFMDFDAETGSFAFSGKTDDRVAMSMTEDHRGWIWAATYPNSHVISYAPDSRELVDYGGLNEEEWPQYPRSMAVGQDGWVYIGIGNTFSHLIAYEPRTGKIVPLAASGERVKGTGAVLSGKDGKVYGRPNQESPWYELKGGQRVGGREELPVAANIYTGSQEYVQCHFPDGSLIEELDLPERSALIRDAGAGQTRALTFSYATEGSHVISLGAGPDGSVCGTTGHPLRLYAYDPDADAMTNHGVLDHNGHWNAVTAMGGKFYGGQYGHGILWEYDPAKPWADTDKLSPNPRQLVQSQPIINRPHELLAHPDGIHLILTGTPDYGLTGGGMHIYNVQSGQAELLSHEQLIPDQATFCLKVLADGMLVGGTSTMPGTGGEVLAEEAELYLFDFASRCVVWRQAILPGTAAIRELAIGPDGLVYGLADGPTFFVFDAAARELVHRESVSKYGGLTDGQAPRSMLVGLDRLIYAYFKKAIVCIEPGTFRHRSIAPSPVDIGIGIALINGRFYFASGSHVYSYEYAALGE